jgi:hypothetical protein
MSRKTFVMQPRYMRVSKDARLGMSGQQAISCSSDIYEISTAARSPWIRYLSYVNYYIHLFIETADLHKLGVACHWYLLQGCSGGAAAYWLRLLRSLTSSRLGKHRADHCATAAYTQCIVQQRLLVSTRLFIHTGQTMLLYSVGFFVLTVTCYHARHRLVRI